MGIGLSDTGAFSHTGGNNGNGAVTILCGIGLQGYVVGGGTQGSTIQHCCMMLGALADGTGGWASLGNCIRYPDVPPYVIHQNHLSSIEWKQGVGVLIMV